MSNNGELMPAGPLEARHDCVLRDPSHPRALINLVPEAVANAVKNLPEEYLNQAEPELKAMLKERKREPTIQDHRIRFMFWKEYDRAQMNGTPMTMTHVYSGICSRDSFYLLLQNKERTAWLLCPPTDYVIACEEALNFGLEQLREILECNHKTIFGAVDAKAASVKLEIVKMLDLRVKGAVIQTNRNVNVNVNAPMSQPAKHQSVEDIDKRLKDLEGQLQSLNQPVKSSTINKNIEDAEVVSDSD